MEKVLKSLAWRVHFVAPYWTRCSRAARLAAMRSRIASRLSARAGATHDRSQCARRAVTNIYTVKINTNSPTTAGNERSALFR